MYKVKVKSNKSIWSVFLTKRHNYLLFEWYCCPNNSIYIWEHRTWAVPMSIKRKAIGEFKRLGYLK